MSEAEPITPVIFRKLKKSHGDCVIALFPAEPGTDDPHTCSDYVHVGQHGSCDPQVVMRLSRPALEAEYAPLKRELESAPYGYRFQIYHRLHRRFLAMRRAELKRLNLRS